MYFQSLFTLHYFNIKVILYLVTLSILTLYSGKYNLIYMILIFFTTLIGFYYVLPCPDNIPYGFNISKGFDFDYMITLFIVFLYAFYMTFIPANFYTKSKPKGFIKHFIYNTTTYSIILTLMYYFNSSLLNYNFNVGCLIH